MSFTPGSPAQGLGTMAAARTRTGGLSLTVIGGKVTGVKPGPLHSSTRVSALCELPSDLFTTDHLVETHGSPAHYRTGNDHDDSEFPGIEGLLPFSRDRALSGP